MENYSIYLSPSAQEYNIGFGDYGSEEYRMNRITDILERLLKERGYTVYRNNPENSLAEIVNESNRLNPDIHVAIHSNASGGAGIGRGPEIYTNREGTMADTLAHNIYEQIVEIYPEPELGRGVLYTTSLYEVRETLAPTVLLEVAFHDNELDATWIMENEQVIAEAIFKGIDNYFINE
ncbi:MAG: N-acetylmuramoyl-L-alanine amidase [Clostridia bacterium]|nr:N-acetylmuramoyl-L-alanine amidase [Clostridia bacterium]